MKRKDVMGDLVRTALAVRLNAYAPYSKYLVGSAVLTERGTIYVGCNVESADYDGTHAEEAALAAMVAAGERSPVTLIVFGALEGQEPAIVMPCGKCRQKLVEFSSLSGHDLEVIVGPRATRPYRRTSLSALLPESFGPADIGVDLKKYRR
jgi:cytidine deaminase